MSEYSNIRIYLSHSDQNTQNLNSQKYSLDYSTWPSPNFRCDIEWVVALFDLIDSIFYRYRYFPKSLHQYLYFPKPPYRYLNSLTNINILQNPLINSILGGVLAVSVPSNPSTTRPILPKLALLALPTMHCNGLCQSAVLKIFV